MSRAKQWMLAGLVFGLFTAGIAWIFQMRVSSGDVYPVYSSLRADALGTRAFHDALQEIPGVSVERDFRPISQWHNVGGSARVIAGAQWRRWLEMPKNKFSAINSAAGNGSRIIVAFASTVIADEDQPEVEATEPRATTAEENSKKKTPPATKKAVTPGMPDVALKKLTEEWGVTLKRRWLLDSKKENALMRAPDSELGVPAAMRWPSDLFFSLEKESPWRVLYTRGGNPVLIEKRVGAGSIVLMAESFPLSNEAMQRNRATELLAWLVGDHRWVVFVESELGVLENNGVGALARRYGLGGALALLVLLGALYAWRRAVEFVPRNLEERGAASTVLSGEPSAGMVALLHRSLRPKQLLAACMAEWRKSKLAGGAARPGDERVEAAWREAGDAKSLSETYNALSRARKPR